MRTARQPPDLVTPFVAGFAIASRLDPRAERRERWCKAQFERELSRFIAFICSIHDQATTCRKPRQASHRLPARGRFARLSMT